jgi:signal transduction histidine kinase
LRRHAAHSTRLAAIFLVAALSALALLFWTTLSIPEPELEGSFRDSLLALGVVLIIVLAIAWLAAERLVLRPASRILDGMAEALDQRKYELDDNQERLAAMSRRLIAAQEDERRRIARELHDELGQLLTGAKLNLVSLQGGMALPQDGFDPLDDTLDLVGRALATVRELSTELRPAILDEAGLAEALHWLLDRVALRAAFEARFDSEPVGALPTEVETTLFRFAQEALTNVMRHAAASHVSITLERRGSILHLTVRDDGVGFYADAARARSLHGGSLGLIGMEERITLAGGHLEIDSLPGRGTTLHATVPVGGKIEEDWEKAAAS